MANEDQSPCELSQEEILIIEDIKEFLKEEDTPSVKTYNRVFDTFGHAAVENPIATKFNHGLFHTVIGRTVIFSMLQFNTDLRGAFVYLFGLRMNALIEYALDILENTTSHDIIVVTCICFVILVVLSIWTSIQNKALMERMGDNTNIIRDTHEDKRYAQVLREKITVRNRSAPFIPAAV